MRTPKSFYLEIKTRVLSLILLRWNVQVYISILKANRKALSFLSLQSPLCLAGNIWILLSASASNLLQSVVLVEVFWETQTDICKLKKKGSHILPWNSHKDTPHQIQAMHLQSETLEWSKALSNETQRQKSKPITAKLPRMWAPTHFWWKNTQFVKV